MTQGTGVLAQFLGPLREGWSGAARSLGNRVSQRTGFWAQLSRDNGVAPGMSLELSECFAVLQTDVDQTGRVPFDSGFHTRWVFCVSLVGWV